MSNLFDPEAVRRDFPLLSEISRGKPIAYLDSAASSQKPLCVIEKVSEYYTRENANIHRGVYELSQKATVAYEAVREKARAFLNAADTKEIIFVRGTTEAINLVARSYGGSKLEPGAEVLISEMEHHSNIVPWQMICEEKGAVLKVVPMNDQGELIMDGFVELLSTKTKIVAITHQSNALGTINDVRTITQKAHAVGAVVLLDGAQASAHVEVDVQDIGCDFYTVSSHKLFGPTGVGVLYGRAEILSAMPPYHGGGDMIKTVTFEKTEYKGIPHRFEAGTPAIAQVIGFGEALDYIAKLDWPSVESYEKELLEYASSKLIEIEGLTIVGTAANKAGVLSFTLASVHPHDIGTIMDSEGVCIRAGHHCAQPVMDHFGIPATARASMAFYNTRADIDSLVQAVGKAVELFR